MLTSLALIFLVGLSAAAICGGLRLPRIIGMLFTGIILGPHVLGLLDDKILSISSELWQMALIISLLKKQEKLLPGTTDKFSKLPRKSQF